jgi:hypothetical protein
MRKDADDGQPLHSDEFWELIEPLIPQVKGRHRYPGRKPTIAGSTSIGGCASASRAATTSMKPSSPSAAA